MTASLEALTRIGLFTLWLAAILTCVVGAWLGVMLAQDLVRVTFDARPV